MRASATCSATWPSAWAAASASTTRTMTVRAVGGCAGWSATGVELVPAGDLVEELRAVKEPRRGRSDPRGGAARRRALYRGARERGLVGRTEREVAVDLEHDDARAAARRGRRSRRSWPPARTARCRTPSRATWRSPRGTLVVDRLGREARRLLLGLHAHVRDRRSLDDAAARGLRARAPRRSRPRWRAVRAGADGQAVDARGARHDRRRPATASTSATASATAWGWRCTRRRGWRRRPTGRARGRQRRDGRAGGLPARASFGVRIEDLVVVTDDGPRCSPGFPRTS